MPQTKATLSLNPTNLVWIDLEMTGLDPEENTILQVAVVVTDDQLHVRVNGPEIAVYQPPHVLDTIDVWNKRTHGKSGLLEKVTKSPWSESDAEEEIISFLKQYVPENTSHMCGNILGLDRRFLARHMPRLHAFFHYSDLDANGLEIMAKRWRQDVPVFVKKNAHSARADINEAIDKMLYYRAKLFR